MYLPSKEGLNLIGIGPIADVYAHVLSVRKLPANQEALIEQLAADLNLAARGYVSATVVLSVICSYLNTNFRTSQTLFSVDAMGNLVQREIGDKQTVIEIAERAGIPAITD